jgi:flagellar FliL protein
MAIDTASPPRIATQTPAAPAPPKTPGGVKPEPAKSKGKDKSKKADAKSRKTDGKGKSKKKLIIIGAVALLAVGGGLKFTVLAGPAKVKVPVPGPVIPMDEMTLNLTGGHFLRIKIGLETILGGGHGAEELDTSKAAQIVLSQFSNRSPAELTGEAARTKAKDQLLVKVKEAYPDQILDVYYTEFVMQ